MSVRGAAILAALAGGLALAGCASDTGSAGGEAGVGVTLPPAPGYAEIARRYNANATRLKQFRAQVQLRVTFLNREGDRQTEECDGLLQVIRPSQMALSFRKVSQTLFWLGSNPTHYWWLDLTGDDPIAAVGRHENFGPEQARLIGLAMQPLDMIRVLGCVPLPEEGGVTQWSGDGKLIGVSTPIGRGRGMGRQRVWIDPRTDLPVKVELYDADGRLALVADLIEHDSVRLFNEGTLSPQMATKIDIRQLAQDTRLILFLSGMQDGTERSERPITAAAFDFAKLQSQFKIEKVADLDRAAASPAGATQSGGGRADARP